MYEDLYHEIPPFDRFTILAAILDTILKVRVKAVKIQRSTPIHYWVPYSKVIPHGCLRVLKMPSGGHFWDHGWSPKTNNTQQDTKTQKQK